MVSLLVVSFHAIIVLSHFHAVEAFSSKSQLLKQPGYQTVLSDTKHFSRQQFPHAPQKIGSLSRNQRTSYQGRPFSSSSKFFVAPVSGKSLNISFNDTAVVTDEDEVLWECILDPDCCDECIDYREHMNNDYENYGSWYLKEDANIDKVTLQDKITLAAFGLGGVSAFTLLILFSGPGAWRFFLAGGLCAATSHAIPTPLDVVKTKKQVDPALQDLSFVDATKKIVKDDGIDALLVGLGPTIVGYLLEGAMKFGVYEVLKPVAKRMLGTLADATSLNFLRSQIIAFMFCGAIAGTAASVALAPMEALRIRLVSEPDFAPKGGVQGFRRMVKREGVLSLWKGIAPQIYKQVPYTVTKNVGFDILTKMAYRMAITSGISMTHGMKFTIPFLAAGVTSILACISSQPGDMLLSLVSAHQGDVRSTNDFARDIIRSDKGIRGFFVGLNCRIYHVGIIVTLQLVLYDFLKRLCGVIATGSV